MGGRSVRSHKWINLEKIQLELKERMTLVTRGPGGQSEGLLGGRGGVGTLGVLKCLSNVE